MFDSSDPITPARADGRSVYGKECPCGYLYFDEEYRCKKCHRPRRFQQQLYRELDGPVGPCRGDGLELDFDIGTSLQGNCLPSHGDLRIVCIDDAVLQHPKLGNTMRRVLETLGERSRSARKIPRAVTSGRAPPLPLGSHRVYLLVFRHAVLGLMQVGPTRLSVVKMQARAPVDILPLCVLDFYVFEDCQRRGLGLALFRGFLERTQVRAGRLAFDRPSSQCLGFLKKHFRLTDVATSAGTNPVLFSDYWSPDESVNEGRRKRRLDEDTMLQRIALDAEEKRLAAEQQNVLQQQAHLDVLLDTLREQDSRQRADEELQVQKRQRVEEQERLCSDMMREIRLAEVTVEQTRARIKHEERVREKLSDEEREWKVRAVKEDETYQSLKAEELQLVKEVRNMEAMRAKDEEELRSALVDRESRSKEISALESYLKERRKWLKQEHDLRQAEVDNASALKKLRVAESEKLHELRQEEARLEEFRCEEARSREFLEEQLAAEELEHQKRSTESEQQIQRLKNMELLLVQERKDTDESFDKKRQDMKLSERSLNDEARSLEEHLEEERKRINDVDESRRKGTEDAQTRIRLKAERLRELEIERERIRTEESRLTEEADERRLLLLEEEKLRLIEEQELMRLIEVERHAFLDDQRRLRTIEDEVKRRADQISRRIELQDAERRDRQVEATRLRLLVEEKDRPCEQGERWSETKVTQIDMEVCTKIETREVENMAKERLTEEPCNEEEDQWMWSPLQISQSLLSSGWTKHKIDGLSKASPGEPLAKQHLVGTVSPRVEKLEFGSFQSQVRSPSVSGDASSPNLLSRWTEHKNDNLSQASPGDSLATQHLVGNVSPRVEKLEFGSFESQVGSPSVSGKVSSPNLISSGWTEHKDGGLSKGSPGDASEHALFRLSPVGEKLEIGSLESEVRSPSVCGNVSSPNLLSSGWTEHCLTKASPSGASEHVFRKVSPRVEKLEFGSFESQVRSPSVSGNASSPNLLGRWKEHKNDGSPKASPGDPLAKLHLVGKVSPVVEKLEFGSFESQVRSPRVYAEEEL